MRTKLRRALNPKASRAPASFNGAVGIELGTLLEFETTSGVVLRSPRGIKLLWFPKQKALAFFEKSVPQGRPSKSTWDELESKSGRKAKESFAKWADRESKKARRIDFNSPKSTWERSPDKLTRIDYRSDKWGGRAEYTHATGRGVSMWLLSHGMGNYAFWVFKGGSLRVTAKGIEG